MGRIIKDPEERRKELIDTAERLFIAEGYDQTAIRDMVREVNVSQGAFYYYLDSRDDILVAVVEKQLAQIEDDFHQIAARNDIDEVAKLNSMASRFLCISASGKKILGYVHLARNATLHMKLMGIRPFARIAPIICEVIDNGCKKGRFHVKRPLETSYLLLVLMASANHIFYQCDDFFKSINTYQSDKESRVRMSMAMEDLLGRALGVSDLRFILEI